MDDETRKILAAHKKEIDSLNGELFAVRALLFYFLDETSVRADDMVRRIFDTAANHAENQAIGHGKAASPEHLVKALGIIEDFRAKIFGKSHK